MLQVTERAAEFYKEEMELQNGDSIRLFVRYGGGGMDGFTIGVDRGDQHPTSVKTSVAGVDFYNNPEDDWLVDLVTIDLSEQTGEIHLAFEKD